MPTLWGEHQLEKVDLRTREAKCAQKYMAYKGYRDIRPIGQLTIESREPCWYFYYQLPEGVLELEVDTKDGINFERRVALFVHDPPKAHLTSV